MKVSSEERYIGWVNGQRGCLFKAEMQQNIFTQIFGSLPQKMVKAGFEYF